MADNFKVLDASASTVTFRSTDVGLGVECSMSIPTNTSGTALIGIQTSANSIPVVVASDQATLTTVLGAALPVGTNAIGTVSALLLAGTNAIGTASVFNLAGTNAIGTVSAFLLAGTQAIGTVGLVGAVPAGTNAIGTVSITNPLPGGTNAIGTVSALQVGSPWGVAGVDTNPATINITAVDAASSSTSGNNSGVYWTGTPTANSVASAVISGQGLIMVGVSNTFSATLAFELQDTNGFWFAATATQRGAGLTSQFVTSCTNIGVFEVVAQGKTGVRVRCTTFSSGTATIAFTESTGFAISSHDGLPLPPGTNAIGTVSAALLAGTNAIGTVSVTNPLPAGTNAIGTVSALLLAGTNAIGTVGLVGAVPAGTNAIGTVSSLLLAGTNAIGTVSANLIQLGGTALAIGQGVMTASIPVVIASNQSNLTTVISGALPGGTNAIGTVSALLLAGTNAIGTVSALLLAGTNAIGTVSITGAIPGGTNAIGTVSANLIQVAGVTIATGGLSGLIAVGGGTASGNAVSGNPLLMGGRAQQAEQGTTAGGNALAVAMDNVGKLIISPYANKENFTSGGATLNTTSAVTLIAAATATTRYYVTSIQFGNSGATLTRATMNDPTSSVFVMPGTSQSNVMLPVPWRFGLGSAITVTCQTAVASAFVNVQGYVGT